MAGKKILVADDSLTIQKVIRLALSNEGYDIQTVSDGKDAVQQIAVYRPDVVLIDVSLPGKSAIEVKKISDAEPSSAHVRFVMMSSAFERVDEQQIKEVQFHGQLTKPFDPAHLRKVLSDVLATAPREAAPPAPARGDNSFPHLPTLPNIPAPNPEPDLDLMPPLPDSSRQEAKEPSFGDLPPIPSGLDFDLPPPNFPASPPRLEGNPGQTNDELWGSLPNIPEPPNASPMQPPKLPAAAGQSEDNDIRHLTESTIRMSGLDDFDWAVKEPSLTPPAGPSDSNLTLNQDFPSMPESEISLSEPDRNEITLPDFDANDAIDHGLNLEGANFQQNTGFQGISQETVEQLIRKEVQEALEKVAQRLLPDIAERVIKQEIHRLLSEQP